jgi:hypothetical protein
MDRAIKEAERIRNELAQIERVISNAIADWNKFASTGDDAFLKAVAYDLHGFYTGLENIFNSIADTIDDHVPQGENWHKAVLSQMALEIKNIRPAVISEESVSILDEYLRFRHRIRNIYSFNLVPDRIKGLVEKLPSVFQTIRPNLNDFAQFLERLSKK